MTHLQTLMPDELSYDVCLEIIFCTFDDNCVIATTIAINTRRIDQS